MHLYLFVLPDLFGKDSVLDFEDSGYQHELLHKAFDIKKVGNMLSSEVAGRSIHPPFPSIGHFLHVPSLEKAKMLIKELKKIREPAIEFVHLFHEKDFTLEMPDIDFIAISNKDYSFLGHGICTHSDGYCIPEDGFERFFKERLFPIPRQRDLAFKELLTWSEH